jgi:hypothetical protein
LAGGFSRSPAWHSRRRRLFTISQPGRFCHALKVPVVPQFEFGFARKADIGPERIDGAVAPQADIRRALVSPMDQIAPG